METFINRLRTDSHLTVSLDDGLKQAKEIGQGKGRFVISAASFTRREKPRSSFPPGRFASRSGKDSKYQPLERKRHGQRRRDRCPYPLELERTTPMAAMGYYPGDPHLHFPREGDARRSDHP